MKFGYPLRIGDDLGVMGRFCNVKLSVTGWLNNSKVCGKNSWIGVDNDSRVNNISNWLKLSQDRAVYRRFLNATIGPRAHQPRE